MCCGVGGIICGLVVILLILRWCRICVMFLRSLLYVCVWLFLLF